MIHVFGRLCDDGTFNIEKTDDKWIPCNLASDIHFLFSHVLLAV